MDVRVSGENNLGWEMVTLGITVPRSYFCMCCLVFHGAGMNRGGLSYCLPCWERRQGGVPCSHESSLPRKTNAAG